MQQPRAGEALRVAVYLTARSAVGRTMTHGRLEPSPGQRSRAALAAAATALCAFRAARRTRPPLPTSRGRGQAAPNRYLDRGSDGRSTLT